MGALSRARHVVGSAGLNRGSLVRQLARLGTSRLRALVARSAGPGAAAAALRVPLRFLAGGSMIVPAGAAEGLRLDLARIPLSHAHLGALAHGTLEAAVQEAMRRHVGPGGVFYDVGANVGFFALIGARLGGEGGHAYAFEPAPDNADAVRANAAVNGIANLTVIEKAVSAAAGSGRLQVVDDQSWSKLLGYGAHPGTQSVIDVELVSLDDLADLRPPTVVKIDVEGAELAVLEGMRRTIAEHGPAIICELHGTHAEVAAFLRDAGYRVINLESAEPVETAGPSAHVLALPPLHAGD